jgi:hypothetical protein
LLVYALQIGCPRASSFQAGRPANVRRKNETQAVGSFRKSDVAVGWVALAAVSYQAKLNHIYANETIPPTAAGFLITVPHTPTGEIILWYDGSGQSFVPGDTHWTYFPARTWDTTHVTQSG